MEYTTNNVRTAMRIRDIKIRDLAKKLKTSKSTIHSRLQKESEVKLSEAKDLAELFGVSMETLFYASEKVFLEQYVQNINPKTANEKKCN